MQDKLLQVRLYIFHQQCSAREVLRKRFPLRLVQDLVVKSANLASHFVFHTEPGLCLTGRALHPYLNLWRCRGEELPLATTSLVGVKGSW